MNKQEFNDFLKSEGLTHEKYAELTGRTRETVTRYGARGRRVPRSVEITVKLIRKVGSWQFLER